MLRTAFSTTKLAGLRPGSACCPSTSPRRVQAGARPGDHREAQAQGGSGASVNFWLYLRNSIIFATIVTVGQVFFSAMAAYAFARLQLARPGHRVRPVPGRADGAADLHHAAQLRPDQGPRAAQHASPA